jgi:phthalate 4,5-dioxygenase oxygenase subunit
MLTREENDLLTRTDADALAGQWMRRYWLPAALSEELPMGGPPLPIRLLGEDLVLFRTEQGEPGLLGIHCSHRGADLSYGRLEDGGLRCIYHGWLYDVHGRCLEQPGEPVGSTFHQRIQHPAYPCVERAGAIFAYLGPAPTPEFPNYEFFSVPDDHVFAIKLFSECNYLQGSEGNYDWIHTSFLHHGRRPGQNPGSNGQQNGHTERLRPLTHVERVDAQLKPWGLRHVKLTPTEGGMRASLGTFIMPSIFCFGGGPGSNAGHSLNWHVPIDDTHHWKYTWIFNRERPLDKPAVRAGRADSGPDYKPLRNRANRYLQDRASMASVSYSGIAFVFQPQDLCVTEGAGPIADRTQEHLGSTDIAISIARKLMFQAIDDVAAGKRPAHVVESPEANRFPVVFARTDTVPDGEDWRDFYERIDAELGAGFTPLAQKA